MMFFYFKVSSKVKHVLELFFQFLTKLERLPMIIKYFVKRKKQKVITVLRSPHVNKTAQEQFEFRVYKKGFVINSTKPLMLFSIIKKIKNLSFPGIKLEAKGLINLDKKNDSLLKVVNPDNIILNKNFLKESNRSITQLKYIQIFDCYGEHYLRNLVYTNSLSNL